ncbi:MAG: O-antigen ligase family protein [Anaerolineae bacterium]|nr:O-antigen ligase family protein [Anaerolineae bacterium]
MEYIHKLFRAVRGVIPPILVMYAAAFGGNVSGLYYDETKIFSLVLLLLVVPFAFRHTRRPPALLPLTVLVAVMCITMLASPSDFGAWLVLLWAGVVIAFWASEAVPVAQLEQAVIAVIAALALVALYDMIGWWLDAGFRLAKPLRPPSTLWNPNIVAPVMMIGIALALYSRRVIWLTVFLIVLVFAGSRATFLGMGVGAVVLVITRMPRPQLNRTHVFLGTALAILLVSLFVLQFRSPLQGLPERADLWRVAVITFLQHPLTGIGPERYRLAFLELVQRQLFPVDLTHAHNTYLHVAAEMGVLGLLALGGIIAAAVLRIRQAFHVGHKQGAAIAAALLGGLLAHGLLDYVYWVLALVLMLLWTGRILVTPQSLEPASQSTGQGKWRLMFPIGIAVLGYPAILLGRNLDRQLGWLHQSATGMAFLIACTLYAMMPAAPQASQSGTSQPSEAP